MHKQVLRNKTIKTEKQDFIIPLLTDEIEFVIAFIVPPSEVLSSIESHTI